MFSKLKKVCLSIIDWWKIIDSIIIFIMLIIFIFHHYKDHERLDEILGSVGACKLVQANDVAAYPIAEKTIS